MLIDKGDHRFIHPWGMPIYQGEIDVDFFQSLAERTRENGTRDQGSLAGNIKDQFMAARGSEEEIIKLLTPHIINYLKHEFERVDQLQSFVKTELRPPMPSVDDIDFDFGNGPWFNFMRKGEFNPLHAHNGQISGIIMIKVPKEIENEYYTHPVDTNVRCPGYLEWVSDTGSHKVVPKEGDIYLFDARLRHLVYPFESDVERITSSFNVFTSLKDG